LRLAREVAADLRQRGEDGADAAMTVMGHRVSGLTCFFLGEFLAARAHLEQALARFDPAHRPFYMSFDIQDPLVTLLYFLSQDLFCLGYLDQARLRSKAAVDEARKLDHAHSLAISLFGACRVDWATGSHEELLGGRMRSSPSRTSTAFPGYVPWEPSSGDGRRPGAGKPRRELHCSGLA
jgi:hypothetical protein